MMGAILISFTVAVYVVAVGAKADVTNVTIGIIDHDQSTLSQRIRAALQMPMFQTPVDLTPETAQAAMDEGRLSLHPRDPRQFEADIHGQRPTTVQCDGGRHRHGQAQLGIGLHHRDRVE
jgi:ABC-2 type transport system permease protein